MSRVVAVPPHRPRAREIGAALCRVVGLTMAALVAFVASDADAIEADVMAAKATCTSIRTCDFEVTVRHADIGFSHYADRFEIVAPDGEVLGIRTLRHPHVHEQPFTRGLTGVDIPDGVARVVVRAHDSQHAYGGRTVTIDLTFPSPQAASPPTLPTDGDSSQ